ncbi:hypothetical protein MNBD_GAMMA20-1750 [hydrothermal vent metagenome]|uniref:YdhG-like domain-containing protein n=1 Tax=hydrothermal vent metagenome TaxID=652676 RepID=A0A3B1ARB8_9ZZZZ
MSFSNNDKVDSFLNDIQFQSPEMFEILMSIRTIFHDTNLGLVEDIKYGGLVFTLSNTLIGGIFVYAKHISIEFSFGAELPDPDKILEGKGKKRRHIKIHVMEDVEKKKVKNFVGIAVNLN